jgi:hypothetical protein
MLVLFIAAAGLAAGKASASPELPTVSFLGKAFGTVDPQTDTCSPIGFPVPATFENIFAITRSGTIINVAPGIGTQLGEIRRIGGNRFAVGFFGYLAPGVQLEIRSTLDLGEESGDFLALVTDANGELICQYAGVTFTESLSAQPFPE